MKLGRILDIHWKPQGFYRSAIMQTFKYSRRSDPFSCQDQVKYQTVLGNSVFKIPPSHPGEAIGQHDNRSHSITTHGYHKTKLYY